MQKGKKFLSDLKLHSDYFKWLEDKNRYETWEEACENIIDGHRKKYKKFSKEVLYIPTFLIFLNLLTTKS